MNNKKMVKGAVKTTVLDINLHTGETVLFGYGAGDKRVNTALENIQALAYDNKLLYEVMTCEVYFIRHYIDKDACTLVVVVERDLFSTKSDITPCA